MATSPHSPVVAGKQHARRRWLLLAASPALGVLLLLFVFWLLTPTRAASTAAPAVAGLPQQQSGAGTLQPGFTSADARTTQSVAWGDVDGDGDLDLAAGNGLFHSWLSWLRADGYNQVNQLYTNNGDGTFAVGDILTAALSTRDVAWGDWDGDGDLDLAVANGGDWSGPQPNQVFENVDGRLQLRPEEGVGWESAEAVKSASVAWGDWDGDGDLDLAVGNDGGGDTCYRSITGEAFYCYPDNFGRANQVYENISGTLSLSPTAAIGWQSNDAWRTRSVAWGDVDGDGDLDLAAGNYGDADQVYENISGTLQFDPANGVGWQTADARLTHAVAWGDWDNDGDLDLVLGGGSDGNEKGYFLTLYENVSGTLQLDPGNGIGWQEIDDNGKAKPADLVWGDWDGDGDLDLYVGTNAGGGWGWRNRIYENDGDALRFDPAGGWGWQSPLRANLNSETSFGIAVGDAEGDGDLDLAVGNGGIEGGGQANVIFTNQAPVVALEREAWPSPDARSSTSLAWGDWDGDDDLDLAVGNYGQPNQIYENVAGVLQFDPQNGVGWQATVITDDLTTSVAWGDWDGDDDLDLAVGNEQQPAYVYENEGGELLLDPANGFGWRAPDGDTAATRSVAWGDFDRDGDLDLAVGNCGALPESPEPQTSRVYENEGGTLQLDPAQNLGWASPELACGFGAAWGDWDNDGDLDLALGTRVYENVRDGLYFNPRARLGWEDGRITATSVAWSDYDGDGDLDLAAATWGRNRVYENDGGTLRFGAGSGWESLDIMRSYSVAWGDVDGDGDQDLAVANAANWGFEPVQVFENVNGRLARVPAWETSDADPGPNAPQKSHAVAWGDVDNDGDLDLAVANYCAGRTENQCDLPDRVNQVYRNALQSRETAVAGRNPAANVRDPNATAAAYFYASPQIAAGNAISIPYTLVDPNEVPIGRVEFFYSLSGGENWLPARPSEGTQTTNLATSAGGTQHVFRWDPFGSNFFGQSDNVVVRLVAYRTPPAGATAAAGTYRYRNSVAGSYQRPFVTATSAPFRVQSTQVRVVDEDGAPVEDAWVFRLPAGQVDGAQLMPTAQNPLPTDDQGLLPGGGALQTGDRLIALRPATADALNFTGSAALFYTSAPPDENGLDMLTFREPGIVELTVSEANPLLLFNLDVALEWDAQGDDAFQAELANSLERASELLFDVTNGQAALGRVRVFQGKEYWPQVDVVVLANNGIRPSAAIGGVAQRPLSETVRTLTGTKVISNAYVGGQIRMGTVWDPFGENTADLGPDWWQSLAHELAHYLLFLPDNYLGFKGPQSDALGRIDCRGSFMTSTYDPAASEFLTSAGWTGACTDSLAARTTGRTDWETIRTFYPMLNAPDDALDGPTTLPLGVTNVFFVPPQETRTALRTRNFDVRGPNNERFRLPGAQAYLFQTQGTADPSDDVLLPLGSPTGGGDRLKVRGAFPGDRLCLFDNSGPQAYAGCDDNLRSSDVALRVAPVDNAWQPQIEVRPVTSRTLQISVTQTIVDGAPLNVQVFPAPYWSLPGFVGLAPTAVLSSTGDLHTQALELRLAAHDVAVRVWVDGDPGRESISQFLLDLPLQAGDIPSGGAQGAAIGGAQGAAIGGAQGAAIGGAQGAAIGGAQGAAIGGAQGAAIGGAQGAAIGGAQGAAIGGAQGAAIGGAQGAAIGGAQGAAIGGAQGAAIGGAQGAAIGGAQGAAIGGAQGAAIGGAGRVDFSAPILSADAQVVVYSKLGFFEDNGVDTLQILDRVPGLAAQPWLLPVGQAYRVKLDTAVTDPRAMAFTYLQRDVPEGYEEALGIYFLADGADAWRPLPTEPFVENLLVADLQPSDGVYAVMASVAMPPLTAGWNLIAYTLPVSRTVSDALASIADVTTAVRAGAVDPQTGVWQVPTAAPATADGDLDSDMTQMEFGKLYWVYVTEPRTLYLRPPVRSPEGRLR